MNRQFRSIARHAWSSKQCKRLAAIGKRFYFTFTKACVLQHVGRLEGYHDDNIFPILIDPTSTIHLQCRLAGVFWESEWMYFSSTKTLPLLLTFCYGQLSRSFINFGVRVTKQNAFLHFPEPPRFCNRHTPGL